jgi:hypothetical protein
MLSVKSSSWYFARPTSHCERDASVVRCSCSSACSTRVSGASSFDRPSMSTRPLRVRSDSRSICESASATTLAPEAPTPLMSTTAVRCWASIGTAAAGLVHGESRRALAWSSSAAD